MTTKKNIFVSYSHADKDWCHLFNRMLQCTALDVWVDVNQIRIGNKWNDEINNALNLADAVLLLISPDFIISDFIQKEELPRILQLQKKGLRLFPVLVHSYSFRSIDWLGQLQIMLAEGKPLSSLGSAASEPVASAAAIMADEIRKLTLDSTGDVLSLPRQFAVKLLGETLLQSQPPKSREIDARTMLDMLAKMTRLNGPALITAMRFFIEFHLLRFPEPESVATLMQSLNPEYAGNKEFHVLQDALKKGAYGSGDYSTTVVQVDQMFFMWACAREHLWQKYFELVGNYEENKEKTGPTTVAMVEIQAGFIVPQFLIAGLMSRFGDEWKPVLRAFSQSIRSNGHRGNLESLLASQWNTWLMWGPSIPMCSCSQWQGNRAFQFGYGDENNSLPIMQFSPCDEAAMETPASEKNLASFVKQNIEQGKRAIGVTVQVRLRWAPSLLTLDDTAADVVADRDLDLSDPWHDYVRDNLAPAQKALLSGEAGKNHDQSDGLILQFEQFSKTKNPQHVYFTAYYWMMFLVAKRNLQEDHSPLLRGHTYPDTDMTTAAEMNRLELWRNLLPIFVHANIGDQTTLQLQRHMLVDGALSMLRQLWHARADYFDAHDVKDGIGFYLVCASDYSGCGEKLLYPPALPLEELLRQRLAEEPDQQFAATIILPTGNDSAAMVPTPPWEQDGNFSACHLPDMVEAYYEYVKNQRR